MISGLEHVNALGYAYSNDVSQRSLTPSSVDSNSQTVWTDVSSLSSSESSISSEPSEDGSITASHRDQYAIAACAPHESFESANAQSRHPRRTVCTAGTIAPPALLRQSDRKVNFVDNLVDTSASLVEAIWPQTSLSCRAGPGNKGVLPIRTFIQETLKRSRTSYSTLQVALYYLILIKSHVPRCDASSQQGRDTHSHRVLQCGRRMFLAALILASKYLQDRNFSARAWSKISGLNTLEINQNEMAFLLAVKWKLHIPDVVFHRWSALVLQYTPSATPAPACNMDDATAQWKAVVSHLTPELDNIGPVDPCSLACNSSHEPFSENSVSQKIVEAVNGSLTTRTLEPSPASSYYYKTSLPAYGLLPTSRLATRIPAVNPGLCVPQPAMAMALGSQAMLQNACETWPVTHRRRMPLARTSSSTSTCSRLSMLSPESMISDASYSSSGSSSSSGSFCLDPASLSLRAPEPYIMGSAYRGVAQVQELAYMSSAAMEPSIDLPTPVSSCHVYYEPKSAPFSSEHSRDLAAAHTLQELRTGDIFAKTLANRSYPDAFQGDVLCLPQRGPSTVEIPATTMKPNHGVVKHNAIASLPYRGLRTADKPTTALKRSYTDTMMQDEIASLAYGEHWPMKRGSEAYAFTNVCSSKVLSNKRVRHGSDLIV